MGPFDDEFQRRMRLEESMRCSFVIDDATRRALADFDLGRQARELVERSALMTNVRDQFDRSLGQMHSSSSTIISSSPQASGSQSSIG